MKLNRLSISNSLINITILLSALFTAFHSNSLTLSVTHNGSSNSDCTAVNPCNLERVLAVLTTKNKTMTQDIIIELNSNDSPGSATWYEIKKPIILEPKHSGFNGFRVHWRAKSGKYPRIVNRHPINGTWAAADEVGAGVYKIKIPKDYMNGHWDLELWDEINKNTQIAKADRNSDHMRRFNFTDKGFSLKAGESIPEKSLFKLASLQYDKYWRAGFECATKTYDSAVKSWTSFEQCHNKNQYPDHLESVLGSKFLRLFRGEKLNESEVPPDKLENWNWLSNKTEFGLKNGLFLLDENGEFFYDNNSEMLYYKPTDPGVLSENYKLFVAPARWFQYAPDAPLNEEHKKDKPWSQYGLFTLLGTPDNPVKNITFEGLTLALSSYGGIEAYAAENITIKKNYFFNLKGRAIGFRDGGNNIDITENTIGKTAKGVQFHQNISIHNQEISNIKRCVDQKGQANESIRQQAMQHNTRYMFRNIRVSNNYIVKSQWASIEYSPFTDGILIENNTIKAPGLEAILNSWYGGCWDVLNNVVIKKNYIENALSLNARDRGAIYIAGAKDKEGRSPATIERNYISGIYSSRANANHKEAYGIYVDVFSENVNIERNVLEGMPIWGRSLNSDLINWLSGWMTMQISFNNHAHHNWTNSMSYVDKNLPEETQAGYLLHENNGKASVEFNDFLGVFKYKVNNRVENNYYTHPDYYNFMKNLYESSTTNNVHHHFISDEYFKDSEIKQQSGVKSPHLPYMEGALSIWGI